MHQSIDPSTGQLVAEYPLQTHAQLDAALQASAEAQAAWRRTPLSTRLSLLTEVARVLRARAPEFASLISLEMGKPIVEAESEIEKCAWNCDFYAQAAPRFLAPIEVETSAPRSAVVFDPLGTILAIMPWNYPFWQVFRFLAPALAAGNGVVLKHAANVGGCARAIEDVLRAAGSPSGLFQVVFVDPAGVEALIQDDRIAAVTLTGSTQVGAIVASQAGAALKKQVLELGGSDPFIVLADADLEVAAAAAVKGRFINAGQSCVNAKRFIVEEAVASAFVDAFVARVEALKLGDPMARDTHIGPMARESLRDQLHDQVLRSLAAGAVLRTGGRPAPRPGYFYEPTLLDQVRPGMAAFDEETFGPVAAVIHARDADDALRLANMTEYGLGASIWTRDLQRAGEMARCVDAGAVFINAIVASDPRLPFGGVKKSGYGRELGDFGLREFTNIKTIVADTPAVGVARSV